MALCISYMIINDIILYCADTLIAVTVKFDSLLRAHFNQPILMYSAFVAIVTLAIATYLYSNIWHKP